MKRLFIVGAGGWGREVLAWALDVQPTQSEWEIAGFLDSNPNALEGFPCDRRVLGDPLAFQFTANDLAIVAIGDPSSRLALCLELKRRGAEFITLIHPSARVGPHCELGEGCIVCPNVVITTNVKIGEFVGLNVGTCVGHDVIIGRGSMLNPYSGVMGCVKLGEGVFLGANAIILPGAVVGDRAVVGAGSVVLREVKERTSVFGVPGRLLKTA